MGADQVKEIAESIAVAAIYGSWLVVRPWFPQVSRILLLVTNFATAICVAIWPDVIPVPYVLEGWHQKALVAFEVVAAGAAVAAFRYRPALLISYFVFAIHFSVLVWFLSHPLHFEQMNVLDYG